MWRRWSEALNVIIAQHENLRTTIQVTNEQTTAVVHDRWPLKLKRIDLGHLPADLRSAEVERLLVDEPRRLYHLNAEPGIRATIVQLDSQDHVFILMMHHIICDWSSEGVLWRELSAIYRALIRGDTPALPPLQIQHGDYAAMAASTNDRGRVLSTIWRTGRNTFAAHRICWICRPIGPGPLLFPIGAPVNASELAQNWWSLCVTPAGVSKLVYSPYLPRRLMSCCYRYTGKEDILLGIPLADRDRPQLQSVIGFLLHTHVLRTKLAGDMRFRELLASVQRGVLDLYSHRAPPFDQVVSRVQPERNLSYSPLFQVMINWRDRDQQLSFIGMKGLVVTSLLAETKTSKFDLTVMLTDDVDEIWVEVEYSTDLFKQSRIGRMMEHLRTFLKGIVADPTNGSASYRF